MTSSTLYREGDDLDALLAELSDEYAGQVRVLGVEQTRTGGVKGFFARPRVAVRYVVEQESQMAPAPAPRAAADPLAELIDRAESAETRAVRGRISELESATRDSVGSNAEFASLLLELAAQKKAAGAPPRRRPAPRPAPQRIPEPRIAAAVAAPPPAAASLAPPSPPAVVEPVTEKVIEPATEKVIEPATERVTEPAPRNHSLVLRRELAELGVPIHLVPDDAGDVAGAVHTIVRRLPAAPRPPAGTGRILAIVGPGVQAVAAARQLRDAEPGGVEAIWTIGVARGLARGTTLLQDAWAAAGIADTHRERDGRLAIVVVATDGGDDPSRTPSRALRAVRPDAVWAVVDATRKPADTRKRLATIDLVDALVVVGAAETSSPATVLELELPVAMLDGHPATAERWTAALFDTVGGLET